MLCLDFEFLFGLSVLALMCGCLCEGTIVGTFMMRSMDRATRFVQENTELIFRAGTGFFFIAIWAAGGILLTPELKTNSTLIAAIQLGIAAGMLSRRTMPLSAVGIFILFAVGVWNYGIFHLADYPVFLGVALYLRSDGTAARFLRRAADRCGALVGGHHLDVGVDREMGLSGMVVSVADRTPDHDVGL